MSARPLCLALAAALLGTAVLAPGAPASVRCSHSPTPGRELRLIPYEDPHIDLDFADGTVVRRGNRILVLSGVGDMVECRGPVATVANTETILFLQGGLSFNTVDLSGGLPAPHIEFRTELGALGFGTVRGTRGADRFALGGTPAAIALTLDPTSSAPPPIIWDGLGVSDPVIQAGPGNDTVDATAVTRPDSVPILEGGDGNDTLLGSAFADGLDGGRGRDLLSGGAGNDDLDGRDGDRDRLDCGPGHGDRVEPGRDDRLKSCEEVVRPRPPRNPSIPKIPGLTKRGISKISGLTNE